MISSRTVVSSLFVLLLLFSCGESPRKVIFGGETQGTYYAITYFENDGRNFQVQVDSILHAFDLSVSMWIPESIISKINDGDSTVVPDKWFLDIFRKSVEVSVQTGGAFDFTVGPLVNAWGFGAEGTMKMDQSKVDSLLKYVGYDKISLSKSGKIIRPEKVRFDFNSIAQGYAVDLLGDFLEEQGISNYLIDIGGEVLAKGLKPGGKPWMVGIENPAADSLSERTVNTRIKLSDQAVSTSGNYRKYRVENGIRYSHTIDPKTGYPVTHSLLSVTVLANDCATADAYATAFMVMGADSANSFIANHPGIEAYFILSGQNGLFTTYGTNGFDEIIVSGL